MVKRENRVAAIERRCSPQGRTLLDSLRLDPFYAKVIRALGDIEGQLSYRDIEDVVIQLRYRRRSSGLSNENGGVLRNRPPARIR